MYDKEFYRKIYDLLADNGQVKFDPDWYYAEKEHFASYFIEEGGREWRFQGDLGFGGKFRADGNRHYVYCYPEDETPKRKKLILNLNEAISKLEQHWNDLETQAK